MTQTAAQADPVLRNGFHDLLSTPAPTRASDGAYTYSFGGWAATSSDTMSITSVTIAGADVTVYAIWDATPIPTYSVIYDANGGSGGPGQEDGLYNGSHDLLSTPAPTRDSDSTNYYSFGGWAATSSDTTSITSVNITDSNVTVYAIWNATEIPSYSVIYDTNGSSGGPGTEGGLYSGSHNLLTTPAPTRASDGTYNYSFGGWAATATGTTPITSVNITESNITVYAIWNATSISVNPPVTPPVAPPSTGVLGTQDKDTDDTGISGVAGASDKLPQTAGISTSTLLGLIGIALVGIGGASYIIISKRRESTDN